MGENSTFLYNLNHYPSQTSNRCRNPKKPALGECTNPMPMFPWPSPWTQRQPLGQPAALPIFLRRSRFHPFPSLTFCRSLWSPAWPNLCRCRWCCCGNSGFAGTRSHWIRCRWSRGYWCRSHLVEFLPSPDCPEFFSPSPLEEAKLRTAHSFPPSWPISGVKNQRPNGDRRRSAERRRRKG